MFVLHLVSMSYTIENEIGNIVLVRTSDKYYIARIDRVGQFFCSVKHPLAAGKSLFSSLDLHGLVEVAKVLPELTAKELFERIVGRHKAEFIKIR